MNDAWGNSRFRVQRLAEWVDRDGVVVLECPKPPNRHLKSIGAWFSWWTGSQRIRLDEIGSSMWRLFDGSTTLEDIAVSLREELGDDAENIEGRIDLFVSALYRRDMVKFL
jgi:hypothetical protein